MKILEKVRDYLNPITRGAIDGSLSTLGIVIGAISASPKVVIAAGLSGGVANGLSNMFAAVSAEKTEMLTDLSDIEDAMLKDDLRDTVLHEVKNKKVRLRGFVDGISTILGALIPVTPYFFAPANVAVLMAIFFTSLLSFFLGFAMASVSGRNILKIGVKMAIIAIMVAIICTVVQQAIEIGFRGGSFYSILK